MADELTIPILPCKSIDDILTFYKAVGFEVTYHQAKPNTYAALQRGGINLHFFTLRDYDPAQSYSTCYISVPDASALYQTFAAGLRQHYGRLPTVGIPRITPLRHRTEGELRFNLIDPGGNWIRIGQAADKPESDKAASTKLSRAVNGASILIESKVDYPAAAKLLDAALANIEPAPVVHRVQALVLRANLALSMDDHALARRLLDQLRALPLTDEDRAALDDDLQRADSLEQMLT